MSTLKNLSKTLFVAFSLGLWLVAPLWSQDPQPIAERCPGITKLCKTEQDCEVKPDGSFRCVTDYYYYPEKE